MAEFKVGDIVANRGYESGTQFKVTKVTDENRLDLEVVSLGDGIGNWWSIGHKFQNQGIFGKVLVTPAAPEGFVSVEDVEAEIKRVAALNGWCKDGQDETRRRLGIAPKFTRRIVLETTEPDSEWTQAEKDYLTNMLSESSRSGIKYRFVSEWRI